MTSPTNRMLISGTFFSTIISVFENSSFAVAKRCGSRELGVWSYWDSAMKDENFHMFDSRQQNSRAVLNGTLARSTYV